MGACCFILIAFERGCFYAADMTLAAGRAASWNVIALLSTPAFPVTKLTQLVNKFFLPSTIEQVVSGVFCFAALQIFTLRSKFKSDTAAPSSSA